MDRQLSNPDDALASSLQNLSIGQGVPSFVPTSPSRNRLAVNTVQSRPAPALKRKTSNLGGSLPNSPLRRQSSSPALPSSPAARPISRSPSMASLHRSESSLAAPTPPLPPLVHPDAETLVILNDSSFLHKYSRHDAAEQLDSIVERPERIRAATFGISVALCKLEAKKISVLKTDRKGALNDPSVTRVHDAEYLPILTQACDESSGKIARKELELPSGWHVGDLYLCGGSREDLEGCVGAVWEGVDRVFGPTNIKTEIKNYREETVKLPNIKRAFVSIRPPGHHCADKEPSGFCYLNNVHVAIARAALQYDLTHAVIFDFDLHHGDGSQSIAWDVNDRHFQKPPKNTPHIAYYSLHDINSYPCEMGDTEKVRNASTCLENAHHQNIWNVHLEKYTSPEHFWQLYREKYSIILKKAEAFLANAKATYKPYTKTSKFKAGIFISAGFDASEHESSNMQRHKVNVLTEFYAKFTSDSVDLANKYADGRVLSVLEGGYSNKAIWTGVFSHLCGLAAPQKAKIKKEEPEPTPEPRLDNVSLRRGSLVQDLTGKSPRTPIPEYAKATTASFGEGEYDPAWFGSEQLDEIDRAMLSKPPVRKQRDTSSTYFSPTTSSAAKAAAAPRLHRKSSTNLSNAGSATPPPIPRSPSPPPPPPPLEWPAASAAVWRSLLPDQQLAAVNIESAKLLAIPGELTNTKSRPNKRHSAVGIPAVDIVTAASTRTLRDRKKTTPDIPDRTGSSLSSVAETLPSRRASMASVRSSDTTETAITGMSQITSRRKVSPPQKTTSTAKATVAPRASRTSTGGAAITATSTTKPTARKSTSAIASSTGGPVKAPARTSSVRQSTGSRKSTTSVKTNMPPPPARVKTEENSVSPIEATTIPSIKTTAEPDSSALESITSSMQSIKLTYKNREADEIEEQKRVEDQERQRLEAQERQMEEQIARIQEEKRLLLERKQRKDIPVNGVNGDSSTDGPIESRIKEESFKLLQNDLSQLSGNANTEIVRPSSKGKGVPKAELPQFTSSSTIPFAQPINQVPLSRPVLVENRPRLSTTTSQERLKPITGAHPAQVLNGSSFRDRIAAMTPPKPKEKGPWQVGDEITPARVYKPAPARVMGPHTVQEGAPEAPPRRVDEDLK